MAIREWLARVDEDRIRARVHYLASDPLPRRTLNFTVPGHTECTLYETDAWVEARLAESGLEVARTAYTLQAFGCDETKPIHHWYAAPPPRAPTYTGYNLEAGIRGDTCPDEIIWLVAHKDSPSWIDCPGALDNGVGTVATLEMAAILAARGTRRTVRFLFCNEEHTPWTSEPVARAAWARGDRVVAVLNTDSISGKSDEETAAGKKTNVTAYTVPEGRVLADLMARVNDRYGIGLDQRAYLRDVANDDDGSFVKAGYGCAVANLGSFPFVDPQYHLPGDVPGRVDYANVRMSTQAILAAVLELDEV